MYRSAVLRSTISRERIQRRIVPDAIEQLETSIKLSKIPQGVVAFNEIENLPSRELAYTAHIANRAGMQNEKFWDRISKTFLESVDHKSMTPKYMTQILVGILKNTAELNSGEVARITSAILNRLHGFRFVDLVILLNSFGPLIPRHRTQTIVERVVNCMHQESAVSEKSVAILCSGLGRMGLFDSGTMNVVFEFFGKKSRRVTDLEMAAIARYISKCEAENSLKGIQLIQSLIQGNKNLIFSPSSLNIVLNSVFELGKNCEIPAELLDYLILQQIPNIAFLASSDSPDLLPHLFFFSAGLARTEEHLAVVLRIATRISRHYKEFKAVAIPLVVEGLQALLGKNFENPDVESLLNLLQPISESVVEKFLLLASTEEKQRALTSSYCVYCSILKHRIENELQTGASECSEMTKSDEQVEFLAANLLTKLSKNEYSKSLIERMEKVVVEKQDQKFSFEFFSLVFRIMAIKRNLFSVEFRDKITREFLAVVSDAPMKTAIRCMYLLRPKSDESRKCFDSVCSRMDEISSVDLPAFLRVAEKLGLSFEVSPFADEVEAKIANLLSVTKSVHVREEIVSIAKRLGLGEPEDVMDALEEELIAANRKSR